MCELFQRSVSPLRYNHDSLGGLQDDNTAVTAGSLTTSRFLSSLSTVEVLRCDSEKGFGDEMTAVTAVGVGLQRGRKGAACMNLGIELADRLRRSGLAGFGFDRKRTADDRSQQLLPLWMVEEG